jgi:hypothetical protein
MSLMFSFSLFGSLTRALINVKIQSLVQNITNAPLVRLPSFVD